MQENNYSQTRLLILNHKALILAMGMLFALFITIPKARAKHKAQAKHQNVKPKKHPRISTFYPLPQNGLGGISGRIMGNLVPLKGASIALMQENRLIDRTVTDEEGNFVFKFFTPGQYEIIAAKAGFRTSSITGIPVKADNLTRTDFYVPLIVDEHTPSSTLSEDYDRNRKFMKEN